MDALSPFTRRLLALALLFVSLVTLIGAILLPGWALFRQSLGRLGDARFQRVQVESIAARTTPGMGPGVPLRLYLQANTQSEAGNRLVQEVRDVAVALNLSPSSISANPIELRTPASVSVSFTIEGKEASLIGLLSRLEREPPLKRVTQWRLARFNPDTAAGAATPALLRLDARVCSAWERR